MSRFLLGINYWPRRSAMYMWQRFDPGEIAEDMARIAELGLDVVRFFLLWEAFQPRARRAWIDRLRSNFERRDGTDRRRRPARDADAVLRPHERRELAAGVDARPPTPRGPLPHDLARRRGRRMGIGDFYADPSCCARRSSSRVASASACASIRRSSPGISATSSPTCALPRNADDAAAHGARGSPIRSRELRTSRRPAACTAKISTKTADPPVERSRDRGRSRRCTATPSTALRARSPRYQRRPVPLRSCQQSFSASACSSPNSEIRSARPANNRVAAFACLDEDGDGARTARGVLERLHARGALGAFWWCWADYDLALASLPPVRSGAARAALRHRPHRRSAQTRRADADADSREKRAASSNRDRRRLPTRSEHYAGLPREHRRRSTARTARRMPNDATHDDRHRRELRHRSRACARAAAAGFDVVLVARRADRLEEIANVDSSGGRRVRRRCRRRNRAAMPARIVDGGDARIRPNRRGREQRRRRRTRRVARAERRRRSSAQWQLNVAAPLRIARAALPHLATLARTARLRRLGRSARTDTALRRIRAGESGDSRRGNSAAPRAAVARHRSNLRRSGRRGDGVPQRDWRRTPAGFASPRPGTRRARSVCAASRRRSAIVNAVPWQTACAARR